MDNDPTHLIKENERLTKQVEDLRRQLSNSGRTGSTSGSFARQLRKNAQERGQSRQVKSLDDYVADLRGAEPSWKKDNLGVRGNPIQFHRQQILHDTPLSTVVRRGLTDAEVQQIAEDSAAQTANDSGPGGPTTGPTPNPGPFDPENPDPEDPPTDGVPSGVDQILLVVRGKDVGFPNSWSVFDWDQCYVYQSPSDTSPFLVGCRFNQPVRYSQCVRSRPCRSR
jgi:hypothetical protein